MSAVDGVPASWAFARVDAQMAEHDYSNGALARALDQARAIAARLIELHEKPPVDPDLLIAREACAQRAAWLGHYADRKRFVSGEMDNSGDIDRCMRAIKLARTQPIAVIGGDV